MTDFRLQLKRRFRWCFGLIALVLTLAAIAEASHIHGLQPESVDDCVFCHQTDHLSAALVANSFDWPAACVICFRLLLAIAAASFACSSFTSIRAPPAQLQTKAIH